MIQKHLPQFEPFYSLSLTSAQKALVRQDLFDLDLKTVPTDSFAGRNGKSTTITLFITGSSVCLIDYSWDLPACGVMANRRTRRNQSLFKSSGIFVLLWICPESSKKCKYHIFCPYLTSFE